MELDWLTLLGYIGLSVVGLIGLSVLVWMVRVRPRVPQLDDDWNSDCELTTTADINGDAIRFNNVRDFFWRTTRDRDESWADTVEVRADEIKDVWFVVDHFHNIHGMAHTFLTFEFNDGTCLSFSFEARRRKGQRYHPWAGFGAISSSIYWLALSGIYWGCAPTPEATRTTCSGQSRLRVKRKTCFTH